MKLQLDRESKAEEMRILYVAMTRAKEKLILVDCIKQSPRKHVADLIGVASIPADPEAVAACRSLGDWVLLPLVCSDAGAPICCWAEQTPSQELISAPGWKVQVWENPSAQTARFEKTTEQADADDAGLAESFRIDAVEHNKITDVFQKTRRFYDTFKRTSRGFQNGLKVFYDLSCLLRSYSAMTFPAVFSYL